MHRCLPLVKKGRKLDILHFMNVDPSRPPKGLDLIYLAQRHNQLLEHNYMHNFKGLTTTNRWGRVA
jgi:hypothetical protein